MSPAERIEQTVIQWLLDSDPAIRWQVMFVHLEIPADDMARAKAFHQDVFGWRIEPIE